jgi:ATP synthase protein I
LSATDLSAIEVRQIVSQLNLPLKKLLIVQSVVVLIVSFIAWFYSQSSGFYSTWVGGLIYMIPTGYMALKIVYQSPSPDMKRVWRNIYKGEMIKLLMSAALFAFAWSQLTVDPRWVFSGFLAAYLGIWIIFWRQ